MSDPIDLVPLPEFRPPRLPGSLTVRATADEAIDAAAFDLVIHSRNCIRTFGDFHVAISVSAGVEPLLQRLMYDPALRDVSWKRAHVWLLDETGDAAERGTSLRELFVPHSDIPDEQLHVIPVHAPDAGRAYTRELREALEWRERGHDRLDFALMELDPDGSVPLAMGRSDDLLAAEHPRGVAMTETFISGARFVALLATGAERARTMRQLEREWSLALSPSGGMPGTAAGSGGTRSAVRLRLLDGELRWYVDHAACGATPTPPPPAV
jgi:6-phosphogluconolactonase/glucosamine-6-phosphate isomerase/deaminase